MKATLTCPHCEAKQEVDVPQTKCLASYECESCEEVVGVPAGSDNCCVICEYSNKRCPVGANK